MAEAMDFNGGADGLAHGRDGLSFQAGRRVQPKALSHQRAAAPLIVPSALRKRGDPIREDLAEQRLGVPYLLLYRPE